jgi:SAM-dependent methyltransferase
MLRKIRPEILDSLPPDHPDARASRRDLRLINRIMGNHRWIESVLPPFLRPGERVLELGAGDGELGRRLAARGIQVDGLDIGPRPDDWPPGRAWHRGNLREFDGYGKYAAVVGNLIFHHFDSGSLADLGRRLEPAVRIVVACEPSRSRLSQFLFGALGPVFGANRVTRHDGRVSIAAGFRGGDLARALGLDKASWNCKCRSTLLGAHRLVAIRRT